MSAVIAPIWISLALIPDPLIPGLIVYRNESLHAPGIACGRAANEWWCWYITRKVVAIPTVELFVNLRDHSTRDACVRALWARLRPDEPEPLTAPRWFQDDAHVLAWVLWSNSTHYCIFARTAGMPHWVVVPALADIDLSSPDRDLLALRAVALAVLGGSE